MQKPRLLVAALGAAVFAFALVSACGEGGRARADAEHAIGEWRRPDGTRIQLQRCRELLCGRIVKVPDPVRMDLANPDPRLRVRPVVGVPVLTDARRSGTSNWKGQLYEPESGRTYAMRMSPENRATLAISLCSWFKIFCSEERWVRVR